jgi:hypothetical protein
MGSDYRSIRSCDARRRIGEGEGPAILTCHICGLPLPEKQRRVREPLCAECRHRSDMYRHAQRLDAIAALRKQKAKAREEQGRAK